MNKTTSNMRKILYGLSAIIFLYNTTFAQSITPEEKYSPTTLKEDLVFIKNQLFNVHANAFTELSKTQYEKLFSDIEPKLTDSMTAVEFLKLVKPAMAYLSDEHANIGLPEKSTLLNGKQVFLPLSLKKENNTYRIDSVLLKDSELKKGDIIKQVDNLPVEELIKKCSVYTVGFPGQRTANAVQQFGLLYTWATPFKNTFTITLQNNKKVSIGGVDANTWLSYLKFIYGAANSCEEKISYKKYGETGYINACTFSSRSDSEYNAYARAVKNIFTQIQQDKVKQIIIDVSKNSGGNSALGDLIIAAFYDKPYGGYQLNWKRSDEYLKLMKSWGANDDNYERHKPGEIIHFDSDTTTPQENSFRFPGKVYVLIGNGTFSSAIMFATTIKDNGIAPLIGQAPANGHPSHFGEMYGVTVPHTKLSMRFGVKEWIRPAGNQKGENILIPDIRIDAGDPVNVEGVIANLPK